jgi:hypothetical protein
MNRKNPVNKKILQKLLNILLTIKIQNAKLDTVSNYNYPIIKKIYVFAGYFAFLLKYYFNN